MNTSSQSRSLSAIMFTDIAGYTRLMREDEEVAMELVRKNREIQKPLIEKHGGTWLKEMGDGTMSSFQTPSEAIYCAKEIQKANYSDPNLNLRIGIHIGEIIEENGDIYGDGVNIASRLESVASPGGICISESVNGSIQSKSDIDTLYLGEVELKNVDKPVGVYAVKDEFLTLPEYKKINRKPILRRIALPFGIMVFLALIMYMIQLSGISSSDDVEVDQSTLAVFPFRVQGNDDLKYLEEGMVDLVSSKLNGLYNFKTIDPHMIVSSIEAEDMNHKSTADLYQQAAEFGAGRFILGNILQLGDSYRIKMSIYGKDSRSINEAEVTVNNENELVRGIDDLVREALSNELAAEGLETEGLTVYASDDFLAIKSYLEGEGARRRGNYREAVVNYSEAVEIDSTMSISWLRLWQSCAWDYGVCNFKRDEILDKVRANQEKLPRKLKEYVDAAIAHYTWDLSAEQQFRDLIQKYGESVDFLIGMGEELFHKNEAKGRMPSEAMPYFLKAWEYDTENAEIINHLVTLLANDGDTLTLQKVLKTSRYDSDKGYMFKAFELLTSGDKWEDEDIRAIYEHPQFDYPFFFNALHVEYLLSRQTKLIEEINRVRGEPYPNPPDQPFEAIVKMWGGKEEDAAKLLKGNPFMNYIMPIANIEEGLNYFEEYQHMFPMPNPESQGVVPYELVMAINAMKGNNEANYQQYYDQLKKKTELNTLTIEFLIQFLEGIKERKEGNFEISNQILIEAVKAGNLWLPEFSIGFIKGSMKMAIAENYYDLENYMQSLHWYKVRFNMMDAGDEVSLGFSFLRRGQIAEKLDDYETALLYYERFLDLYKDCDPKYKAWVQLAKDGQERMLKLNM